MISINELADEYENQYKLLCTKIEGLRPLLCIYKGEDLYLLRRKIKTYCDNGIIPSINLIMTYETSACPIGMERIEQVAEYYFG